MAILTKPTANVSRIFDLPPEPLPPKGTYVATCLEVKDVFGVERRKYESEEMEKVDLTAFLFGYRTKDGAPYKIATRSFRISGNEKSALFGFLKSWLGRAPQYGWDYAELRGTKALITVDHEITRDGNREYAVIVSISPLPESMAETAAAPAPQTAPAKAAQAAETAAQAARKGRLMRPEEKKVREAFEAPQEKAAEDDMPF